MGLNQVFDLLGGFILYGIPFQIFMCSYLSKHMKEIVAGYPAKIVRKVFNSILPVFIRETFSQL